MGSRRAKFISLSVLTDDFLDTTGEINSYEGELESGDMISLIVEMGQFGFEVEPGEVGSTYVPEPRPADFATAFDYKTRFQQYIFNVNDRADYAVACAVDGECKVNFRDQLNERQE